MFEAMRPVGVQQDSDTLVVERENAREKHDEPGKQPEMLNCVVQFGLTGDLIDSLQVPHDTKVTYLKGAIAIPSKVPAELQKLLVDEKVLQEHESPLVDGAATISLLKMKLCEADDTVQALQALCDMGPLCWPSYYTEVMNLAHDFSQQTDRLRSQWFLTEQQVIEWVHGLSLCCEILAPSEFSLRDVVCNAFNWCEVERQQVVRCGVDWRPQRWRRPHSDLEANPLLSRPEILAVIASMLEDTCNYRRFVGACLLCRVGGRAAPYADALAKLLHDDLPEIRSYAALALGSLGGQAARYITPLVSLVCDGCSSVRYRALVTLGGLGRKAAMHSTEVGKCLMDENQHCRLAALRVLKSLGATTDTVAEVAQAWRVEASGDACFERVDWCDQIGVEKRRGVLPCGRRRQNNMWLTAKRVLTNPGVPLKEIFRGRAPLGKMIGKTRWTAHLRFHAMARITKRWAVIAQGALEAYNSKYYGSWKQNVCDRWLLRWTAHSQSHATTNRWTFIAQGALESYNSKYYGSWKQEMCDRWLLIQNQKHDLPDEQSQFKSSRQYWRTRAMLRSSRHQFRVLRALSRRRRCHNHHRMRETRSKRPTRSEFDGGFDRHDVCMLKP